MAKVKTKIKMTHVPYRGRRSPHERLGRRPCRCGRGDASRLPGPLSNPGKVRAYAVLSEQRTESPRTSRR